MLNTYILAEQNCLGTSTKFLNKSELFYKHALVFFQHLLSPSKKDLFLYPNLGWDCSSVLQQPG